MAETTYTHTLAQQGSNTQLFPRQYCNATSCRLLDYKLIISVEIQTGTNTDLTVKKTSPTSHNKDIHSNIGCGK